MKKLCSNCCRETEVEYDSNLENTAYRNVEFTYTVIINRCTVCKEEVSSNDLNDNNLETLGKYCNELVKD